MRRSDRPHDLVRVLALAGALLALLTIAVGGAARAAPDAWRVGVIVSSSAGSALGAQQAELARVTAQALGRSGVFGVPLVVELRDDAGDPRRAEALALELVAAGVHALVCCTTPQASERVAQLAEREGVALLALDGVPDAAAGWVLALRADARTQLTAVAVDAATLGRSTLAIMTPANAFGDASVEAFERALADAGRSLAAEVRYDPGASVLTPEALLAATSLPGAIVVWGGGADSALALEGLRRRAWLGTAYVRPEALAPTGWSRLAIGSVDPSVPAARSDAWAAVALALAPVSLAEVLLDAHPNREAALAAAQRVELAVGPVSPLRRAELALVDDALVLLQRAFEQVAALGLGATLSDAGLRQAVLDALVSAPPQALAAGTYQARSADARLARWQGLVIASTR